MSKGRKVTNTHNEDFAHHIRELWKAIRRIDNDHHPTLPQYDPTNFPDNFPSDPVAGQVALSSLASLAKEGYGFDGDSWFKFGGKPGPFYYLGTMGADNANGPTDTYLALNPPPYNVTPIPYMNGWTNSFLNNTGPGRFRLEADGSIGVYGGVIGGADGTQVAQLVAVPSPLGGWDYPESNSSADGLSTFTYAVRADLSLWVMKTGIV